jgi:peptidoglycan hydrolase-like protein with peptidoglycan-binding domain
LAFALWGRATRRPVDTFAILAAGAASLIIIVNAVFLQSGAHPAPFFANPKPIPVAANGPPKPAAATPVAQPVATRRDDPIADLIAPSPRIAAVQRALSEYGYGQIKPSGMLDDPTSSAIEKFERDHKLPVTGRVSDRLVSDLTAMVGHPLD